MNVKSEFTDRTVLVTGHTGFKGTWLSLLLTELGADVVGYSLDPPSEPNLYGEISLTDVIETDIHGDIRELDSLLEAVKSHQPSVVFHLAAQPIVIESHEHPIETFETNAQGTVHVLEAIKQCPSVGAGIVVTSDKVYADEPDVYAHREGDKLGGKDPYSASKACAEHITQSYRSSLIDNAEIASVRAGNVIGGGDWGAYRLIPDCVEAIAADEPIEIRSPDAVRPWQHVLDPLFGYLTVATQLLSNAHDVEDEWNFGPSGAELYTVRDVVSGIIDRWGKGEFVVDSPDHPEENDFLELSAAKAQAELDWTPAYDTERALDKTVEWYENYYEGETEIRTMTREQIREYLALTRE